MKKLTASEVSEMLGISKRTVTRYCQSGTLKGERVKRGALGRYIWLVDQESVADLIDRMRKQEL